MNKKLILLTLSLLTVTMLPAQNIIRPKVECPNGIYVNSYNGVLFYQRPDVSVANRNMRLEAVFYYNSSSNRKNYGYGNGWSLGSELRFVNDSLGVIIEQGDGRQDLYTRYGNSFEAPAGVFSTLSFEGDGYLLTYKDGTKYYFTDTVSKKVTQVKDRYDNAITYTYQEGNLTTASDISGRSLYFAWSNDLLSGISTSFDDRTWSYQYDENGNLTAVTDPMGYTVHYAYNKDNRIKTFTDAEGYSTHISYNDDGMAHRVKTDVTDKSIRYELAKRQTVIVDYLKDANNQFSTYIWDEKGRVIEKMGNCCGFSSKLAYDDDNNVIRREDANGNATSYTYDQNGNMISATDALGNTEYFTYENIFNNPTSYTDKNGNLYSFSYDANGNLTTLTTPLNTTIQYTYDQYGQVLTEMDANSNVTSFMYDDYGNMLSKTNAMNQTISYTYTPHGLLNSVEYPNSGIVQYTYDRINHLTQVTNPLNNTISLEYDKKGNIVEITDPLFNTMNITPNALGQTIQVTDPLNGVTRYSYNAKGKVVQIQNALNHITRNHYDDHDWLIMSTDASDDTTRYYYDNIGKVIGVEFPTERFITYQYDNMNRLISMADQYGTINTFEFDANGNQISRTDAEGNVTTFQYDELNRLIQATDALNHSEYYSYDNNGNLISYTNCNGNTTNYSYNALNQVLTMCDAMNNVTTYTYDINGNLASITDARGGQTSYLYDVNNQLIRITFANGKTKQFIYDATGRIATYTNESGDQIGFVYDALGRMTQKIYPNQATDYFSYDAIGNMLYANNTDAQVSFTYDNSSRILSETLNGKTTNYTYNIKNREITKTYPCGRIITEEYDFRKRLTGLKEYDNYYLIQSYNANNYLIQRTYGNSIYTGYVFDELNQLVQQTDNSSVYNVQMFYDAVGNMVSKKEMVHPTQSEAYVYDALNHLTSYKQGEITTGVEIPNPLKQIQYTLDALGNRSNITDNGIITSYTANNMNAYTAVTGGQNMAFQYDDRGNMTSEGTHTYQYNYNNQLISVDDGQTATYKYDALNRRIQKTIVSTGSTFNYYYSGNQTIEERNANDAVLSTYIFGNSADDVIQMKRGNNSYYYHKDHLGSVVALTNGEGNLVESYEYDPYGQPSFFDENGIIIDQTAVGNTILYTGRDYDAETGMYFYRARTMHPSLGRFIQQDPITYMDGYNMYSYVNNNPIIHTDHLGLSKDCTNDNCDKHPLICKFKKAGDKYCEQHPVICRLQTNIELSAEICFAEVLGGCIDFTVGIERPIIDPNTRIPFFQLRPINLYGSIGGTLGVGADAHGSASLTVGVTDSKYVHHNDSEVNGAWVVEGVSQVGIGGAANISYDRKNKNSDVRATIGPGVIGIMQHHPDGLFAEETEFEGMYVGGSLGIGAGAHGGYRWEQVFSTSK